MNNSFNFGLKIGVMSRRAERQLKQFQQIAGGIVGKLNRARPSALIDGMKEVVKESRSANDQLKTHKTRLNGLSDTWKILQSKAALYRQTLSNIPLPNISQKTLQDNGTRLKERGTGMRQQATGNWMGLAAAGYSMVRVMTDGAKFQDKLVDIKITSEASQQAVQTLGERSRAAALKFGQYPREVLGSIQILIQKGMNFDIAGKLTTPVALAVKATEASFSDVAKTLYAMDLFGVKNKIRGLEIINTAGKKGSFEFADQAKWLPNITALGKKIGMEGEIGLASLSARLQVATRTAGTNDEAANNLVNYLAKITSPDTVKDFKKAGIDLKASLENMVKSGLDPIEGSVRIVMDYLHRTKPAAAKRLKTISQMTDGEDRNQALSKLQGAFGLGKLFQDRQAMSYLMAELQNRDYLKGIQHAALYESKGSLTRDAKTRDESPIVRLRAMGGAISDMFIAIGKPLGDMLKEITPTIISATKAVTGFVQANPELIKTLGKIAIGLLSLSIGKFIFGGLLGGAGSLLLGLGKLWAGGAWLFGAKAGATQSRIKGFASKAVSAFKWIGGVVFWLGRLLLMNPIGLLITAIGTSIYFIYKYWEPIKAYAKKTWNAVSVVVSDAWQSIKDLFLNFHPLDTIVNSWSPIEGWLSTTWANIKTKVSDAWQGIQDLFFNYHPLGIIIDNWSPINAWLDSTVNGFAITVSTAWQKVQQVFSSFSPLQSIKDGWADVAAWFEALPATFNNYGKNIVQGLKDGIKGQLDGLKDAVTGMGDKMGEWFSDKLAIFSPSRVFIRHGANITKGAALGITSELGLMHSAVGRLSAAANDVRFNDNLFDLTAALNPPRLKVNIPNETQLNNALNPANATPHSAANSPLQVVFSPTINISGNASEADVRKALAAGYQEFEAHMRRFEHDRKRRGYA